MAFTAAGIAVVASAAAAGYGAKRGHDQQVQAKHEMADEKARQLTLQQDQEAKDKSARDQASQAAALQRQRALRMTLQPKFGNIRTSPLGVPRTTTTGGNSYLGAA